MGPASQGEYREIDTPFDRAFQRVADCISDGLLVLSPAGTIVYASPAYERARGRSAGASTGMSADDIYRMIDPEDRDTVFKMIYDAIESKAPAVRYRYRLRGESGAVRWYEDNASFEYASDGTHIQTYVLSRDVTAQKASEDALRGAIAENETLVREIHHRVKNNLSVVAGLLSLQLEATAAGEDVLRALRETKDRIYSMAAIHEAIYDSGDFSHVSMDRYVLHLVESLRDTYRPHQNDLVDVRVDGVQLNVEHAIPVGIILNELVTNSFQHAFPPDERGSVNVTITQRDGSYCLEVADDGAGTTIEGIRERGGLGFQLIYLLAEQIEGDVEFGTAVDGAPGTHIRVCWVESA